MIRKLSEELLRQLDRGISEINSQVSDPIERIKQSMVLVRASLSRLRSFVLENGFVDDASEIYFFKYVKPRFYQHQVYAQEFYQLEIAFPYRDATSQKFYLEQELGYIDRFFRQYAIQYEYYKLDGSELDFLYFLRGSSSSSVLLPGTVDLDPEFSTPCDYLFARFRALESLKEWILEKYAFLNGSGDKAISDLGEETAELRWTGDSVNLAELAYGLYLTRQLNNGSAGVAQIFRWLEARLAVNIGMPAKRFNAIRSRKRLSQTKFLDEMKVAISTKIEQEDGL